MNSDHPRNTTGMLQAKRCGARTRAGKACMAPAVSGKARCRMHGGAKGSGAPLGNGNALQHGFYTREALEHRRHVNALMRDAKRLIQEIE